MRVFSLVWARQSLKFNLSRQRERLQVWHRAKAEASSGRASRAIFRAYSGGAGHGQVWQNSFALLRRGNDQLDPSQWAVENAIETRRKCRNIFLFKIGVGWEWAGTICPAIILYCTTVSRIPDASLDITCSFIQSGPSFDCSRRSGKGYSSYSEASPSNPVQATSTLSPCDAIGNQHDITID